MKRTAMSRHLLTRRRWSPFLCLLCALCAALAGCERRPLEVYYEGVAAVRVDIDWLDHFGVLPSGMSMLLYNESDTIIRNVVTNDVTSQKLDLAPGTYKLTIFSYSPDEYESMRFLRLGNHYHAAARATALTGHARDYWDSDVDYMFDPEDIGVAADTITITPEMLANQLRFIDYRKRGTIHPDTLDFVFHERPDPMTVKLFVKAKVKRWQSISSIQASISGMADGFLINQVYRTTVPGTLYMPDWKVYKMGDEADSLGVITTQIASFGLPYGKELVALRDSADNILTFHIVLNDGNVQDCAYKVGKDIRYLTPTGKEAEIKYREDLYDLHIEVDLTETIVMPPTPHSKNGAGFDAEVDEWEDGGTFDFRF